MNLRVLLSFLVGIGCLSADIEDHFKKLSDKAGNHSIEEIDFIYMINLDERPEKFALSEQQLNPYGVYPCRFSAVNGWELTLEEINDLGVVYDESMDNNLLGTSFEGSLNSFDEIMHKKGRVYFCHRFGRGQIGIVLSHLSVLQDAYDSGYNTIWVMEDDIQVIRNPLLLTHYIQKLDRLIGKDEWDILFTDQDTKNKKGEYVPCLAYARRPNFFPADRNKFAFRDDISKDFRRIGARYGAYSMVIRKSGIKKLLDFIKQYRIFFPFDMEYFLPPDIRLYALIDDVVSTLPNALSDNHNPNYKNK